MIVSNDGIGLVRPGIAIRPAVLHPLPPTADTVQADEQSSHSRHAGHQVHRPVPAPSPGRARLLSGSLPGKALAAQVLWGSREHGLPPVLMRQRMLVADTAAWWAGIWQILWRLASVRSSIACPYQRVALCVRHWQYSWQAQV
jgi:hypothetical protein